MSQIRPRTRKRTLKRRLVFFAVMLTFAVSLLELGSYALFGVFRDDGFSYSALRAAKKVIAGERLTAEDEAGIEFVQNASSNMAIHPYLGYSHSTDSNDPGFISYHKHPVNRFGFLDSNELVTRRGPGKFLIGVLGGSVAYWFSALGEEMLARELHKSPLFADKEIVLIRMAVGGFKQPQQLIALNYAMSLGGEFDLVLNLDGFNEVALPEGDCRDRGFFPFFPSCWDDMVEQTVDPEKRRLIGTLESLRGQRKALARSYSGFWCSHSVTMQLVWTLGDRQLVKQIGQTSGMLAEQSKVQRNSSFSVRGPGPEGFEGDAIFAAAADVWARSSIQIGYLCRGAKIPYLHFLQPNQYDVGAKPIGAKERSVAILEGHTYARGVRLGYPRLSAKAEELRAAGVAFHDLRKLFVKVEEPLYIDSCCHFNKFGNELLAQRVALAIVECCDLANRRLVGLSAPPELRVRSPFAAAQIELIGEYDDGVQRPFRFSPGTRYHCDQAESFTVTADGWVWAKAPGKGKVTVTNGEFTTEVQVEARWDPIVSFGEGIAGTGGKVPILSATADKTAPGNSGYPKITLKVSNVIGGAKGIVVFSRRTGDFALNGARVYVPVDSATQFAVEAVGKTGYPGAGRVSLELPTSADPNVRGVSSYWQVFFADPGSSVGHSSSNALMLTVY